MPFQQIPLAEPINTYVINLIKRSERRTDVLNEFQYRSEFNVNIVNAIEDPFGALGLWKTLCLIIEKSLIENHDYILICEDDHKFTKNYTEKKLRQNIEKARLLGSDILLGGVSWSGDAVEVDDTLFWTKSFSGLQFTIIFKKFFEQILNANLQGYNAADYHLCDLTANIFVVHPFLSIQKSYKYSDVTPVNNQPGRVKQLFQSAHLKLNQHRKVSKYFKNPAFKKMLGEIDEVSDVIIPTYLINLKKRTERRSHIMEQFKSRSEFQTRICAAVEHEKGQVGLWRSIRKIVNMAKKNDDDVILICEDDHLFTEQYDHQFLIRNILKAYTLGADVLLGGISHYNSTVKVAENLFWVDEFYCTQFMVIFKHFFDCILSAKYDSMMTVDGKISSISPNKLVLFPFVSIQKDFGYSDITVRNSTETKSETPFFTTMKRFENLTGKEQLLKSYY